ncbi:MAG: NUDIX domain-containing protein [Myxococcales bacterium]|nr:NUDIX domain-containing protein [Myxococcales bacterium]
MTAAAAHPVVAVAAIVFDESGRVLLIERGRPPGVGLWTVPGGKVHHGEALAAAVAREVREETGLEVRPGPLVAVIERVIPVDGGAYHYVILDYLATPTGVGALAPGDDARAARFVTAADLLELPLTDGLAGVLAQARAMVAAS